MGYDIIVGRNEEDKKSLGKRGLIKIGRGYVKMGQYNSLSNDIYMDVSRSHVVLIAGKRGSGKSYTMGVLTEEMSSLEPDVAQNLSSIIFDTMGIFWTMKYPNEKDKNLLADNGLKPKNLPIKIFVPFGHYDNFIEDGIPVDSKFALSVPEMTPEDWIITFNLDMTNPVSILIQRTLTRMRDEMSYYTIDDIITEIEKDKKSNREIVNAGAGLFEAANSWGIFAKGDIFPTMIKDLVNGGITTVLDLSVYNSIGVFNIRALVVSILTRKLFNERMRSRKEEEIRAVSRGLSYNEQTEKKKMPLVWLFIDEAHEFLPKDEKIISTDALVQALREGRQPGISLVLATQQPGKIHTDVMTQSDIVLAHRVTAKADVEALNSMMQSYLTNTIQGYMNDLPGLKGSAIILDDNSERIYPLRMRPRFTWHGGEAPRAVEPKKEI